MAPSKRNDNPKKRPSVRTSGRVSMPMDSARGAGSGAWDGAGARNSARTGGQTSARTAARTGGQTSARTAARAGSQTSARTAARSGQAVPSRNASSQQQARRPGAQAPAAETRSLDSFDYQSWEVGDVADSAGLDLLSAANAAAVDTDAQQRQDQAILANAAAEAAAAGVSPGSFKLSGFTPMEEPQFLDMVGKEIPPESLEPDFSDFEDLAEAAPSPVPVSAPASAPVNSQRNSQRTSQNIPQGTSQRTSQGFGGAGSQRTAGVSQKTPSQKVPSQKMPSAPVPSQKTPSQRTPSQKVGASQPIAGKSPAEKRAEAQASARGAQAGAAVQTPDGFADGQEAPIPKKKVHRGVKKLLIALGAVVGVAAVCVLLTCWSVWWHGDDAADIQGTWLIGDTTKTMTISETGIKLTKDVTYTYELDQRHKTIKYTFGTLEGGGQYRLSPDKEQLIIVEGQGLDLRTWLKGGFHYRMQRLKSSIFHKDSPVWLDAAAPEGTQVTLLTRKGSDTAAAMKAARQAAKEAAAAEKAAQQAQAQAAQATQADAAQAQQTADAAKPAESATEAAPAEQAEPEKQAQANG